MPLIQTYVHSNSPLSSSSSHSRTEQGKTLVLDVEQGMLVADFRRLVQDCRFFSGWYVYIYVGAVRVYIGRVYGREAKSTG